MKATPFLAKFARPIPSDNPEIETSEASDPVKKWQNRRLGTISTRVPRETTDDQ